MRDYNLARGLAIHTRFDDPGLISRSHVCQNHKMQIVFEFLSTVVQRCMVATHIKKIKHSIMSAVITSTVFVILHFNLSCLSVCSSCDLCRQVFKFISQCNISLVLLFSHFDMAKKD